MTYPEVNCKRCGAYISVRFPTARANELCAGDYCNGIRLHDQPPTDSAHLPEPWWAAR
jgi:hypothetical protein